MNDKELVANAALDCIPMVVIAGDIPTANFIMARIIKTHPRREP